MNIVQINAGDLGGGAARVARALHQEYRRRGHRSILLVGTKYTDDPDVVAMDNAGRGRGWRRLLCGLERRLGWQDLDRPGVHRHALRLRRSVDIVHLHNLHGGYFDLSVLPALACHLPVVLTLHDMWALTGHCAHAPGCDRWQHGCGLCPDLDVYPGIPADGTRFNWQRKRLFMGRGNLHVVAISRWIRDRIHSSHLRARPIRLIHNGIDTDLYCPGDRLQARRALGLPIDGRIVLFSAHLGAANPWKDVSTLVGGLRLLGERMPAGSQPVLVALGGDEPDTRLCKLAGRVISRPFAPDPSQVVQYYRAADVLAYTSRADTCPLTVIEAAACALPVVATAVGGIPDLVCDGVTGLLTPPGDAHALAEGLKRLLSGAGEMPARARRWACRRFSIRDMVSAHLDLYAEALGRKRGGRHAA